MTIKTVIGRVGKDAELRVTQSGKPVVSFSIATTKRRLNRDTNQWEDLWTIWHNVECWKQTDAVATLRKGELVIVQGEEQDASYTNRDQVRITRVKLNADTVGRVLTDRAAQTATEPSHEWPSAAPNDTWATQGGFDENTPF